MLQPIRNLALESGGWSGPRSGRLTPGKESVPIVQGAGWPRDQSRRH